MERLTKKSRISDDIYVLNRPKNTPVVIAEGMVYNKLGKLEDLEEEIGCPLDVVFKALTNGVYYEDVANCMKYMPADLHLNLEGEYVLFFSDEEYLLTRNYKKTWWLKEDKTE